ncbi:MAG: aspartate aminotransferase family protein [Actinomycetales bacterium]
MTSMTTTHATISAAPSRVGNDEILTADRSSVFHSWSAQAGVGAVPIEGGEGSRVWDADGNRYLDLSSQLVFTNLGHQHPAVVRAVQEQAAQLATVAPAHANRTRAEAAQLITERAPEGFNKVFFTNGGADANENAIRMARLFTGRDKVISRYRSYHGNTAAAIAATGDWRRIPNEFARGHVHVFGPYLYRSEFWADTEAQECERALQHLERTVQCEGPQTVAAILLETIPGTAGILVPPAGYLRGVREIADRYGIMLILDEVMSGFARTGHWLALDAFDVVPDLITIAKGVNSGFVPVGGVIISDPIAHHFDDRVFPGGLTYSGHPLAAASVVATLSAMQDEGVVENAARIGRTRLGPGLERLSDVHHVVGEVRGMGVFWAVELVADRQTRTPVSDADMARLKSELLVRGVLPFIAANRLHVVPPAVLTEEEADEAVATISAGLTTVFG